MPEPIIVTTTHTIAGQRIVRTIGLVRGNTIRARHVGHDLLAGLKNIVGGAHRTYVYNDNITAKTSNWIAMVVGGSLMCQSAMFGDATRLPELIEGLRVHAGFYFALLALVVVWVLLQKSFLGFQIKVLTDSVYSKARIVDIESSYLQDVLDRGKVAVVAGFQDRLGLFGWRFLEPLLYLIRT